MGKDKQPGIGCLLILPKEELVCFSSFVCIHEAGSAECLPALTKGFRAGGDDDASGSLFVDTGKGNL